MERARITTENSKLLKELVRFFNLIQWLPNAHGIRFFSEKPWDKVPPSWQTALLDLSEEELYMLSNDRSVRKRTWPLSLQCFFALIDRFQIENIAKKEYLPAGVPKTLSWPDDLAFIMTRSSGMNDKKRHEVEILSSLLLQKCPELHTEKVIDLGCGQGYLCNILGVICNMDVIGIDSSDHQINGAKKRKDNVLHELRLKLRKGKPWQDLVNLEPKVTYVTQPITCSMTAQDLATACSNADEEGQGRDLLIGLHTCGDLAPSMLRMFAASKQLGALINVGCCYNLMTVPTAVDAAEEEKNSSISGYPMSEICTAELPSLIRDVRNLACQSVRRRKGDLADIERVHRAHAYRAIYQYILETEYGITSRQYSGTINREHYATFVSYANAITEKLGIPAEKLIPNERIQHIWDTFGIPNAKKVVAFDSIRTCLAPVIESIILMDRLEFLHEQGLNAELVALFEPDISPRFVGIIASK